MEFIDRVDPEIRPILDNPAVVPMDFTRPLDDVRTDYAANQTRVAALMPEVPGVASRDEKVPGFAGGDGDVLVRIYEPESHEGPSGGIYWIHGGGMILGSYDDSEFLCKKWATKLSVPVVSVEYRLAPEHPYPAPIEDCYAGLRWMAQHADELGVDPSRIVVAGASAGGGLAAGTVLLARDRGEVAVRAQLLAYPMIDDRDATPSTHMATYPKVWNRESNRFGWHSYLGERCGTDDVPLYAAPARATAEDLRGLPPTWIDVGELDAFRDEDIEYALKLLQADVPCELMVTPGAFHASESYLPSAQSSRRIITGRLDALRRFLA